MYFSTIHVCIFIDYRVFTFNNTTPTIAIFVSLLFDRAVSMVKHIMEIVKWNTALSKLVKPPVLGMFH